MFGAEILAVPKFGVKIMTISRLGPCRQWLPQRFRGLLLAALAVVLVCAQTPSALAGQAKPLVKVVFGYGSTDGGVAVLEFAKDTKHSRSTVSMWCWSAWVPDRCRCRR